jgi:beta-lactamase regulating signal transducer with metallopeptidase domain/predicted esterase
MILLQVTFFFVTAIVVAVLFVKSASRSHTVLAAALSCVLLIPISHLAFSNLNWGLIKEKAPVASVEPLETKTDSTTQNLIQTKSAFPTVEVAGQTKTPPTATDRSLLVAPPQQAQTKLLGPDTTNDSIVALPDFAEKKTIASATVDPLSTKRGFSPWFLILFFVWGVLTTICVIRLLRGFLKARLIVANSERVLAEKILGALERAKKNLEITVNVELKHSEQVNCPVIWSWAKPTIIIPTNSLRTEIDWRAILCHELAHLKRGDKWTSLVGETVRCILPWHPLAQYCCDRMYQMSELACDTWAVAYSENPQTYAESLLAFTPTKLIAFSSMATSRKHLRKRIVRVLSDQQSSPQAGITFVACVITLAAISASVTALLQTYRPQAPTPSGTVGKIDVESSPAVAKAIDELTDKQWCQKLIAVSNSAPWYVGKNLGYELSLLADDRGFRILKSCWEEIAVDVRKQILKGFYPGETINPYYFQVMHLGMLTDDKDVQSFAIAYIKAATCRDFSNNMGGYKTWYASIQDKPANQAVESAIKTLVAEASDPKTRNVRAFLQKVESGAAGNSLLVRQALTQAGLKKVLDHWHELELIESDHRVFALTRARPAVPSDDVVDDELISDADWVKILTDVPKDARWYVGAKLGVRLSNLTGSRAKTILYKCWDEIEPEVRRQILKGFTPGFGIGTPNKDYIDILALGLGSPEIEVRSTASVYLDSFTLQKIGSLNELAEWTKANQDKTPQEIRTERIERVVREIQGAVDEVELDSKLQILAKTVRDPIALVAIKNSPIPKLIERLVVEGKVDTTSPRLLGLIERLEIVTRPTDISGQLANVIRSYESFATEGGSRRSELWNQASSIGRCKSPAIIPTLIGIIDSDNSYETVYGIGYFGLRDVTGVSYSAHHDGAWWRRWWKKNKSQFPAEVQQLEIPTFTKTTHSRSYKYFPEKLDTVAGNLEWIIEKHESNEDFELALQNLIRLKDATAVPTLIGILDADNSPKRISEVGRCLQSLTGLDSTPLRDGDWWRRSWAGIKNKFPESVQQIPIPTFSKTEFGKTYTSFPANLDTLDGKIEYLRKHPNDLRIFDAVIDAINCIDSDQRNPSDIPKLIGLIDCDNSYRTIYGIGYSPLGRMCDVDYSPTHDGAWWRRWWEINKHAYPQSVRDIAIPDLPKTVRSADYEPFPENIETIDGKIEYLNALETIPKEKFDAIVEALDSDNGFKNDTEIPKIIGIMKADNSYQTVYLIGEFVLGRKLGIKFNAFHDGQWWDRWWQRNKLNFSAEAQAVEVPLVNKTAFGASYTPFPESLDTIDGAIAWFKEGCPGTTQDQESHLGQLLLEFKDEKAIPVLIGWMLANDSTESIGFAGEEFAELTGIEIGRRQTPQWLQSWWENNKSQFPEDATATPIPDFSEAVKKFKAQSVQQKVQQQDEEFSGVPATKRLIDEEEKKTYYQIGPPTGTEPPEGGWKVLMILPGGDGSAEFHPFCRRIHKNALPEGYIAIQLVAPVWSDDVNRIVWPTQALNPQDATFTTEDFIRDAVADVKENIEINDKYVFALGWSSGGPPLYVNSLVEDCPVTGTYVAMSVFQRRMMGDDLSNAEGHPYFVLHSPDDWIKIDQHARVAVKELAEAGAETKLLTYDGGHGWRGDPYGNIRSGIQWLESKVDDE